MNSNQEVEYVWCMGPWFPARNEAVSNGFNHVFVKEQDGRYRSLSNPQKFYRRDELTIHKTVYPEINLILLLISPKGDNNKGTLIEYMNRY